MYSRELLFHITIEYFKIYTHVFIWNYYFKYQFRIHIWQLCKGKIMGACAHTEWVYLYAWLYTCTNQIWNWKWALAHEDTLQEQIFS